MVQLEPLETPRPGKDAADNRPSPSDIAGPPPAPVDRRVATPPPTSPPVLDANSNTKAAVVGDDKDRKTDPARPGANEPAQVQAIDAAIALRGKAEIVSGSWLVEGTELVQTDAGKGGGLRFGDLRWTDYDFTVELMREKGLGRSGLLFHRTLRNNNHIGFGFGDAIGVDKDRCELIALEDGKEHPLGEVVEFHLVDRRWYRARVSVRRNHIVCTLHDDQSNEHVHFEADYDRLPSGQVGLMTGRSSYRFRNIKVTAPDGKTLWEMPPAIGAPPPAPGSEKFPGTAGPPKSADRPKPGPIVLDNPPNPITNSIGMKLVLIPAGEFLMGSPEDDDDADAEEKPRHRVQITRPFYLGVTEVTQGQYRAVMGKNPSQFKRSDNLPVEQVSWFDAVKSCNKLSEREGRKPYYRIEGDAVTMAGGDGYRLPTEAEWEYACRAGTTTRFSFGDDETALGQYAWYGANCKGRTQLVGRKQPNAFGLYDMHGNVWEWCWDGYDEGYYSRSPVDDPLGPSGVSARVARGGCAEDGPRICRSAIRFRAAPGLRAGTGFRLARVQSVR